jgi:hypothetical protein
MLERKRALRPVDSPDKDTLVYELPSTGETFILRNPHLSMDQIPAVQQEVAGLLDSSLGGTAPPAETAPAAESIPAGEAAPEPAPASAPEQ